MDFTTRVAMMDKQAAAADTQASTLLLVANNGNNVLQLKQNLNEQNQ